MKVLLDGLKAWLAARGLESANSIRGRMSHRNIADHAAFERANYIKTLQVYRTSLAAAIPAPLGPPR